MSEKKPYVPPRYCYFADIWEGTVRERTLVFFASSRSPIRRYLGQRNLSVGAIRMDPTRTGEANGLTARTLPDVIELAA